MWCERAKCQEDDKWPGVQTRWALCSALTRGEWYHSSLLEAIYSQERYCLRFSVCICLCLVLRQWSDWFSCGCLSMCRISLLSQVLYSACLPLPLLPNSCRSLRSLNSSWWITGFFAVAVSLFSCCLMLQILTSRVFIALCVSLVYWFHPRWTCCLPASLLWLCQHTRFRKRTLNGNLENAVNLCNKKVTWRSRLLWARFCLVAVRSSGLCFFV